MAEILGLTKTEISFRRSRVTTLDAFFNPRNTERWELPFGIEIFHIYKDLYEREFKFVFRREHRVSLIEAEPSDAAFIEAAFGGFPTAGPLSALSQAYLDAFDPIKLPASADNWVKVMKEGFRYPLHFTRERLKREPTGWSHPTLFVADPSSTFDLIDLWNIRQFHREVVPVNFQWFDETKDFLINFVRKNYRPLPGNRDGMMIRPTVEFARSIGKDRAETAAKEVGLTGLSNCEWLLKLWYDRIWQSVRDDDYVSRPRRAQVSAASVDLELVIDENGDHSSCRFTSISPEFAPLYGGGPIRWVNVLKFRGYGAADTDLLALTLPSSLTDGNAVRLGSGPTVVSREGFILPQEYKDHHEYFRLMTGKEAVIEWMNARGVHAEPSDPGRIADQIVGSIGGLFRSLLIADRESIRLLDDMSKSLRKYRDGTIEEFPDRSVEVKRWKDLVERRAQEGRWYGISLDDFLKANVFRLGLVLECSHCRKKNWFGIEFVRERLTCERCLKSYEFPQGTMSFDRTPWHYRVVASAAVPAVGSPILAPRARPTPFHLWRARQSDGLRLCLLRPSRSSQPA